MQLNTTGSNNIGIGYASLGLNLTGNGNIGIGTNAMQTNVSGDGNIAIGYQADVSTNSTTNAIALGVNAVAATNEFAIPSTITDVNFGTADIQAGSVSCSPTISSGVVAPSSTPSKVGDIYIDTVALKLYFAAGTASSADWIIAN